MPRGLAADPRITSLTNRMDRMEAEHGELAGQLHMIDGKLSAMQVDIASQFQQVLQGLASLQETQQMGKNKAAATGHS